MLVHGLGGGSDTWDDLRFTTPIGELIFKNSAGSLGTIVKAVNMNGSAAFLDNARILLNLRYGQNKFSENIYPNSFQSMLLEMRNKGFACNRVDYICHSMGGAMGRAAINGFPDAYNTTLGGNYIFKNYEKGFINKYISIQTPHNGSPLAEVSKRLVQQSNTMAFFVGPLTPKKALASSFWQTDNSGLNYSITPAVSDLQFKEGGIRFNTTFVKNHLIGSNNATLFDDCSIIYPKSIDEGLFSVVPFFKLLGKSSCESVNTYFSNEFGVSNFIQSSDLVVPINSQLPGKNLNVIDNSYSKFFGVKYNHMASTRNLDIGNKIFGLLNAEISSDFFADSIERNVQNNGTILKTNSLASMVETVDTSKLKIIAPLLIVVII